MGPGGAGWVANCVDVLQLCRRQLTYISVASPPSTTALHRWALHHQLLSPAWDTYLYLAEALPSAPLCSTLAASKQSPSCCPSSYRRAWLQPRRHSMAAVMAAACSRAATAPSCDPRLPWATGAIGAWVCMHLLLSKTSGTSDGDTKSRVCIAIRRATVQGTARQGTARLQRRHGASQTPWHMHAWSSAPNAFLRLACGQY